MSSEPVFDSFRRSAMRLPEVSGYKVIDPVERERLLSTNISRILHSPQGFPFDYLTPLEANGIFLGDGAFILLLLSPVGVDPEKCPYHSIDEIFGAFKNMLSAELLRHCINYVTEVDGFIVAIACYSRAKDILSSQNNILHQLCVETCKTVSGLFFEKYGVTVAAYMSWLFQGIGSLPREYKKLYSAWEFDMFMQKKPAGPQLEIVLNDGNCALLDIDFIKTNASAICDTIRAGQHGKALEQMSQASDQVAASPPFPVERMKLLLQAFIVFLVNELISKALLPYDNKAVKDLLVSGLDTCAQSYPALRQTVLKCFSELLELCSNHQDKSAVIVEIKNYINESIRDASLCSSKIADNFKISPSQLSTVFKRLTGERLIDYIHKVRIEYAIRLLETSGLPLYEICTEAGFGSMATMHRAFQKHKGLPPAKFRLSAEAQASMKL